MPSFYTRTGDDGYAGLLGEGRVPKYDLRMEALGAIDEATAALGIARAACQSELVTGLILKVQRDLYALMAEVAATPENAARFRVIGSSHVAWLEQQSDELNQKVEMPGEFIIPGDTASGAQLDFARTIIRRAERCMAEMIHRAKLENVELLRYLNRLSSLCFVMELMENQSLGKQKPTLAKGVVDDRNIP